MSIGVVVVEFFKRGEVGKVAFHPFPNKKIGFQDV